MRKLRVFTAVLLVAAIALALSGCTINEFSQLIDIMSFSPNAGKFGFAAYSSKTDSIGEIRYLTEIEISEYTQMYPDTNSCFFKNRLGANAQKIYSAIAFAVDENCGYIKLPASVTQETDAADVLNMFICDNPMLEQNYSYTYSKPAENSIFASGAYELYLDNLTSDRMEKRVEAYEIAKTVVAEHIDGSETDYETVSEIYEYVLKNVEYTDNENYNNSFPVYIYDAAFDGKTNCDGFSSYLSLLLNLADIDCFTVVNDKVNDVDGHAWNIVFVDGKPYHLDATSDSFIYAETGTLEACSEFLVSDAHYLKTATYSPSIAAFVCACTDKTYDNRNVSFVFTNPDSHDEGMQFMRICKKSFSSGKAFVCAVISTDDADALFKHMDGLLKEARINFNVTYAYLPTQKLLYLYR